jgi:hypothetical protein
MSSRRTDNDERYILDICDHVLGEKAERQFTFEFLVGCPGKNGRCARLPVDACYKKLDLVIEYRETQHAQSRRFFDKPEKLTCCGCHRGEQRKLYDERRRRKLPENGIRLIELNYQLFEVLQGKLKRNAVADERTSAAKAAIHLGASSARLKPCP